MSGVKISDLPAGAPVTATDVLPIVRSGTTYQAPLSALSAVIPAGPQGPAGAAGPAGAQGTAGAPGEQGPPGESGNPTSVLMQYFPPEAALYPTSNYAQFKSINGSNFPINMLAFDASTDETVFFRGVANNFNLTGVEVRLRWYADTGTTGNCIWGVSLAAISPNLDSQDIETKALTPEQTITSVHLGTTGQRVQESVLQMANIDSMADLDALILKITRKASSDTMTGDAFLLDVLVRSSSEPPPPIVPEGGGGGGTAASELPAFNTATPNKVVNPALAPNGTTVFSTIQAAVNTANAGDVIAVAPGTYLETVLVDRDGTSGSPIYIQALDPNNRPVIDGQMVRPVGWTASGGVTGSSFLVAIAASHIVWDSIDLVNSRDQGMQVGPADNNGYFLANIATWFSNVKVYRSRIEKVNNNGWKCLNTDGVTLGGCTVRETCRGSDDLWNSTTSNPSGWSAAVITMGKNVTLLENVVAQALGEGIHCGQHISYGTGAFIQVETLVIRNNRVFDTWSSPIYVSSVDGGTIERNVFYNTGDTRFWRGRSGSPQYPPTTVLFASEGGRSYGAPWSTGYIGSVNVTFDNNVVWGGLRLLHFASEPSQLFNGILIRHNTLFGSQPGTFSGGAGAIANNMSNLTDLTFQNNIVYDAAGRIVASDPGWTAPIGTTTDGYNLWSHTAPVSLQGTGDVTNSSVGLNNVSYVPSGAWPSISTFDTDSFKLAGGSPAINAGVTSTVTNDFFGTTRNNPPEIGAYEIP